MEKAAIKCWQDLDLYNKNKQTALHMYLRLVPISEAIGKDKFIVLRHKIVIKSVY